MKSPVNCGVRLIVVLSYILLVLILVMLSGALFYRFIIFSFVTKAREMQTIKCDVKVAVREIQQHGRYWVVRNFVVPRTMCRYDLTLTMQGTYEDIYHLEEMYLGGKVTDIVDSPTSFAVYIPDVQHLNRTIAAIAYVRNCLVAPMNEYKTLRIPHAYIREYVTFHLYFRFELLNQLDEVARLLQNGEDLVNQQTECGEKEKSDDGGRGSATDRSLESVQLQQNAIIVGRNIAQLAVETNLMLGLDFQTYPSRLSPKFIFSELVTNTQGYSLEKTVMRLPMIMVHNMERRGDYEVRMGKAQLKQHIAESAAGKYTLLSHDPFDTQSWLMETRTLLATVHIERKFADFLEQLLASPSYFLSNTRLPLLPEHDTLNVRQNEHLRIYVMLLQHFNFFVPQDIYVLHNVTDGLARSRAQSKGIFSDVLRQYEIVYGPVVVENDS